MHNEPDSLFVLTVETRIMTALPSPEDFSELAPGWTQHKKAVFLDHLAQHGNVRAACSRVGLSREAAYRLRRRDADFARGWGAAMVLANDAGAELLAACATEGIEHRVYFRGELVDTYRRIDTRLLLAHLARLDKAADDKRAQADAARFDELLAVIGGQSVPEGLRAADDVLLDERETLACDMAEEFVEARQAEFNREDEAGAGPSLDAIDLHRRKEQRADELCEAYDRGRAEGLRRHDTWRDDALWYVDCLLDEEDAEFSARTVSDVSTSALAAGLAATIPSPSEPPRACPRGDASVEHGVDTQDSTGPGTSPG